MQFTAGRKHITAKLVVLNMPTLRQVQF